MFIDTQRCKKRKEKSQQKLYLISYLLLSKNFQIQLLMIIDELMTVICSDKHEFPVFSFFELFNKW